MKQDTYIEPIGFEGTPGEWIANGVNGIHTKEGNCVGLTHNGNNKSFDNLIMANSKELAKALQNLVVDMDAMVMNVLINNTMAAADRDSFIIRVNAAKEVLTKAGLKY